jgi:exodeoxyribonuclease-1
MTATYLFYDIETTGLNKAFDQILQFAAIRADDELNEIDRHTISVKLRPDVIPSPRAITTNRISIAELTSGTCEFEAIQQIHQLLNEPDTISLGYNTLGFDDEFLRFSFYRNLLPPYTHQYRHGCRRMDLLPITVMYRLYRKNVLSWPQINGKPSLKLEHLSAANGLISGPSHVALVDVGATIELARIFYKKKKMWDYLEGYFEKATDSVRVSEIPSSFQSSAGAHQMGLMVNSEYGPGQYYQVPVLSIGTSIPYSNQTLWLRLDLEALQETTEETINDTTWVIRKRYGEPGILLPPLKRYWKHLGADRIAMVERNLEWLQSNPELFQKIITHYRQYRYPFIPNLDPDAALYQIGFFSTSDERRCREFLEAPLEKKATIIDQFDSHEARSLAARVLCRNYPEQRHKQSDDDFSAYMARVNPRREEEALVDYKGGLRTTPPGALMEIKQLKKADNLDNAQQKLLDELEAYINVTFVEKSSGRQLTFGN